MNAVKERSPKCCTFFKVETLNVPREFLRIKHLTELMGNDKLVKITIIHFEGKPDNFFLS